MFDSIENLEVLDITQFSGFSIRLLLAVVLGLIIGFERQWTRHQAGILTNIIVCIGAYAYTSISFLTGAENVDPTRVASQVVCGIGFLGAGLIIRDGAHIRGLSTAATIWSTAAVGILCTVDNILYPVIVATAIVILNIVLKPLSIKVDKLRQYNEKVKNETEHIYKISIKCTENRENEIRSHLIKIIRDKSGVLLHNLESNDDDEGNVKIRAYISTAGESNDLVESVLAHIGKDDGIISAGWKIDN